MKKRLLSFLLIIALCLGLVPAAMLSASAEKAGDIYVAGVLMSDGDYLANNKTSTQTTKPSGGYAYYKNGILTLRSFSYTGEGYNVDSNYNALIYSDYAVRIVLEGKNSLKEVTSSNWVYGIEGEKLIKITGEGSLDIQAGSGLETQGQVHIVNTTVSITATSTGISAIESDIYIYGSIVSVYAKFDCIHTINGGNIYISNSILNAHSEKQMVLSTTDDLYVINSNLTLSRNGNYSIIEAYNFVKPNSSIKASSGTNPNDLSAYEDYDSSKNSEYNVITIKPTFNYAWVSIGGVKLDRGDFLASGATEVTYTEPESGGYAYFNGKALTLNNFTYTGDFAIFSNYDLEINLVGTNKLTTTASNNAAISAEYDISIHGDGKLYITSDYPIYSYTGSVYIDDVTLNLNSTKDFCIASHRKNVEINNATVYAYGNSGLLSQTPFGDVIINSSYVDISAHFYGIYSYGSIYIDDSYTLIRSNNTSSDSTYMAVFASEYIAFSNQANVYASASNTNTNLVSFDFNNCETYDYINSTRAVLNYIDIVNIAPAETLAFPDFKASADSGYTEIVDVKWYALDENGNIDRELLENNSASYFYNGKTYRVYVTVRAFKGKEFGDAALSAYIGDKAVQCYSQSSTNLKEYVLYRDYVASRNPDNYTVSLDGIVLKDGEYLADNGTAATTTKPSGGYAYYSNGTLTLENFKRKNRGLRFTESYLNITSIGSNKLSSINDNSLNDEKPYEVAIYGDGYLYVNGMGESDGYAFNVATAVRFYEGYVDLDDELYGFKTKAVYISGAEVYCYVSQGGAFNGECDLYVSDGSFKVLDGGGWGQNINDSVNIIKGDVYVTNNDSASFDDAMPWDGVTSLNEYFVVWVLPEDSASVCVNGIKLKNKQYLAEGEDVPTNIAPSSGGYAYFEVINGKNTLTLNNYELSAGLVGIESGVSLTLNLVGNSNIYTNENGISMPDASLTVEGTGSLTIYSHSNAVAIGYGDLIINSGSLNLSVIGCGIVTYYGNVIVNGGNLLIYGDEGIYTSYGNVEINGGNLDINSIYDGICVDTDQDSNSMVINGGNVTISCDDEDAIDTTYCDFTMNGGKLTVTNAGCCVIESDNIYINDGELLFGSETKTDGLYTNNLTINGGTLKTTGDGSMIDETFICSILEINGGLIEIYGDYAIYAEKITIAEGLNPKASENLDGSNLVAFNAENADSYSYFTCGGSTFLVGDVNADGKYTATDYLMLKKVIFGTLKVDKLKEPETAFERCDVIADGNLKAADYFKLKRMIFQ